MDQELRRCLPCQHLLETAIGGASSSWDSQVLQQQCLLLVSVLEHMLWNELERVETSNLLPRRTELHSKPKSPPLPHNSAVYVPHSRVSDTLDTLASTPVLI